MLNASPHYARDSLLPGDHAAQDELGEWGLEYRKSLAAGLYDAHLYGMAEEEKRRAQHLAATARRWLGDLPRCKGLSCGQDRQPCTDGCNRVDTAAMPADAPPVVELGPIREMACYEPADEQPQGRLMRVIRWLKG